MNTVTLELKLPENIYLALKSAGLNSDDLGVSAVRNLAIQLYADGRLSLGKAAELAGLDKLRFRFLLIERGIPLFNYSEEDYEADLAAVRRFLTKEAGTQ